ncbi:ATP-binding cassette domain-containing protein [Alcanivorax sp. IO_7]|nr:ATP-binding cassette domain-containing protein [Alcanivorax sp. IO_7]
MAITGPSGSGKSTLLGLLAGLDQPSGGEVLLRGEPFSRLDEDGRAAARALLRLRVPGVSPGRRLERGGERHAAAGDHRRRPGPGARPSLARTGRPGAPGTALPGQLSGGEQQRVALARAFALEPDLLFADEPTGSLDRANGDQVASLLFDLNRDHGTALVLVTHDPALAAHCAHHHELVEGRLSA